jgi:hypothetical protein
MFNDYYHLVVASIVNKNTHGSIFTIVEHYHLEIFFFKYKYIYIGH